MKVRELLAVAGPDAEVVVLCDESEDELAVQPLDFEKVQVAMHGGQRRVVIDLRLYVKDIYVDSDQ